MAKVDYSPQVIRQYREMERHGGFDRQIKERTPVNLEKDRVVLACGHSALRAVSFLDEAPNLGITSFRCDECAAEWLKSACEAGK
jgi:hypothetical protein